MAQRNRFDAPGVRHHVTNRGISKRLLFGGRRDYRHFFARLACSTRRGEIQPEAFCVLGTHFHVIARTQEGTISYAMMRIQNGFARWFNRRNKRDGTPHRGRFGSKPIRDDLYFRTAVRYVDHNAVSAGLCEHPGLYPWGSARHYLGHRSPPWLSRSRIDAFVEVRRHASETPEDAYGRIFCSSLGRFEAEFMDQRFAQPGSDAEELDVLFNASRVEVSDWMRDKAQNADGMKPRVALAAPGAVEFAVRALSAREGPLRIKLTRKSLDPWDLLRAGLLWRIAGLGIESIARRLEDSSSKVGRHVRWHRRLIQEHEPYRDLATEAMQLAMRETFGG